MCCNPAHLEPVTSRENTMRGNAPSAHAAKRSTCINGHQYDESNTARRTVNGRFLQRVCRRCRHASKRRAERKKEALR